jgi:hypothetical protein
MLLAISPSAARRVPCPLSLRYQRARNIVALYWVTIHSGNKQAIGCVNIGMLWGNEADVDEESCQEYVRLMSRPFLPRGGEKRYWANVLWSIYYPRLFPFASDAPMRIWNND